MRTINFDGDTIEPGKITCVGKNYAAHIEEMGSPVPDAMVVFAKPNSAIGDTLHSQLEEPLHFEGEICLLLRDNCIAGVGFGLDLTKRKLQSRLKAAGLPWERSKAFDGSALFSAFVPAPPSVDDLVLELRIDGELRQHGGVELMMYKPEEIIAELKTFMTLNDDDIVMTGTPSGVGEVEAGAHFEARLFNGKGELVAADWIAV